MSPHKPSLTDSESPVLYPTSVRQIAELERKLRVATEALSKIGRTSYEEYARGIAAAALARIGKEG